jgi:peptidoglycan hydrolase CwlO-like protein
VLVVVACTPVAGWASATTPASADSVSQLRASIDHVAQQWFDAQAEVQRLDHEITANEQRLRDLERRAHDLQLEATERAVDMYVGKPNRIVDVLAGDSAIDSARRVELIERANAKSSETFDALTDLMHELRVQRTVLVHQRDEQRDAVASLANYRATLDAQLRDARAAALAAARAKAAKQAAAARAAAAKQAASAGNRTTAAPTPVDSTPVNAPAATLPLVVPAPAAPAGVHPMHDHPFLVCTRNRESRGNYGVVSSSGLYYGAYQFLRRTWDVTAIHAGRSSLVGVLPNTASQYDQDDLAWSLYQWQGNAPWGGRC